jgi:hypothetical protein
MTIYKTARHEFEAYVDEWREHCKQFMFNSGSKDRTDCDAYRRIVGMGEQILPFIREKYADDDKADIFLTSNWPSVIDSIIGRTVDIPESDRYDIDKVRDHYIEFLDAYLKEGIKNKKTKK